MLDDTSTDKVFSDQERAKVHLLVVEPDSETREQLLDFARKLSYGKASEADDHATALKMMDERNFTHLLFSCETTNLTVTDFLPQALRIEPEIIALPSGEELDTDEIYELLIHGARGFLMKPFSKESFDEALAVATHVEPLPEHVLQNKDRNEVLVAMMATSLDTIAEMLKEGKENIIPPSELSRNMSSFRQHADLAKMFSSGGEDALLETLEQVLIKRSAGPATRLGKVRKRLAERRAKEENN